MFTPQLLDRHPFSAFTSIPVSECDFKKVHSEAEYYRPNAVYVNESKNYIDENEALRTTRSFHVSAGGEVLRELHEEILIDAVSELIARPVFPTRSSYIYYLSNDFLAPHNDVQQCQVTLLLPLTSPSRLLIYPDIDTSNPDAVFEKFITGTLDGEIEISLIESHALLFNGRRIVHARRKNDREERTVTLCYGFDDE
ncbi:hypothetical protein [Mycolicibacterium fortuitum]|uniref:hypothetical protein n=1 Tax=Mycolicibacterium fortuitum TaxID=1766 RepID=UPI003AAFA61C